MLIKRHLAGKTMTYFSLLGTSTLVSMRPIMCCTSRSDTRSIILGFFATVVLKDYVAAILNTPRADSTWSLDLGKEIKSMGQRIERGTGNVVSVEFAVLYHWHAALSAADAQWMEDVIRTNVPHLKSIDDVTAAMFGQIVATEGKKLQDTMAKDWTFGGLKRGSDGRFSDESLAELIKDCIEEPAHAFGPHGTPASLKIVDLLGQLQARNVFNVCTLNEYATRQGHSIIISLLLY
jgi:hypothetical protein